MLEHKSEGILPIGQFVRRMARFAGVATLMIAFALLMGVCGYHYLAGFSWIDALLNASMILAGMGPLGELPTTGAKLFASGYALFSGLLFIAIMGVVLTPVIHRVLHTFHVERDDDSARNE